MIDPGFGTRWLIGFTSLFCLATPLRAQTSAVISQGCGSVRIDASRLNTVIALDAPWRFQSGDDPSLADRNFDDSGWPLVQPGANRLLAGDLAHQASTQYWARLHFHIEKANGPLAVILQARNVTQYAVYANGSKIGATKGFTTQTEYYSPDLKLVLPQTGDVVLAVHLIRRHKTKYLPLEGFAIGQNEAVQNKSNLDRLKEISDGLLSYLVIAAIFFAAVPFSTALLLVNRKNREYLWLAGLCLFHGIEYVVSVTLNLGWTRFSSFYLSVACGSLASVCSLEFVATLAMVRRRGFIRIAQIMCLLPLAVVAIRTDSGLRWRMFLLANGALWELVIVAHFIIRTYKRRTYSSLFLLVPLVLLPLVHLRDSGSGFLFPNSAVSVWTGHLFGVGFDGTQLVSLLFIAGLIGVVLYRFIRVSKEEQIAVAELEAARTVQQLLIPAIPPATPGFSVESVYLPAQQVGGDFFLVLPAPAGSQEASLLAVMGDVSGKGLQAAMVVATILGGLRVGMSRAPAEVLSYLNRMLTGHISGFATCCAALIHQDGRMQIANAGNPAPYCDGTEVVTLPGLPLGVDLHVTYDQTEHVLSAGDRLTFVSDGVVEATSFPRKELFGFARTQAISTHSARAIAEAASTFGKGAPQADDITVLTVAYIGA